jgi:hypothetical protein
MTLKMRRWRITATFEGAVESESAEEARRIAEGVVGNITAIAVIEGADTTEDADDVLTSDTIKSIELEML